MVPRAPSRFLRPGILNVAGLPKTQENTNHIHFSIVCAENYVSDENCYIQLCIFDRFATITAKHLFLVGVV